MKMRMKMRMEMRMKLSSIVDEVIRTNFFFYEKILRAQKAQKDTYKQTKIKKDF